MVLRPEGDGSVAAQWYERDDDEIDSTGFHCWLTVDVGHIPGLPPEITGYMSLFSNEEELEGGRVEMTSSWPKKAGSKLFAHSASVLPPIDAVFARGSEAVEDWIRSLGWNRMWRYNDNFAGADIVREFERVWMSEYPLYVESDTYAVLGGWHWPCADEDWHELIDSQLMVLTIRDSEPWVEAWRSKTGEFKVIQRIT